VCCELKHLTMKMILKNLTLQTLNLMLFIGALAWNADQLSSGSRDRMILQRDIRTPPLQSERRLQGHRQEVCGLKWSTDHQLLASGGNDNKVFIYVELVTVFVGSLCSLTQGVRFMLPAAGVEPLVAEPCADIHGSPGCSKSHRLVPSSTRPPGLRWRHC